VPYLTVDVWEVGGTIIARCSSMLTEVETPSNDMQPLRRRDAYHTATPPTGGAELHPTFDPCLGRSTSSPGPQQSRL